MAQGAARTFLYFKHWGPGRIGSRGVLGPPLHTLLTVRHAHLYCARCITMNSPIKLHFENNPVATIHNFSYETPWASGEVEFMDQPFFQKLVCVTAMASFDVELEELNLSDAEEESLWDKKLSELGIDEDDLELDGDGRWSVETRGGEKQDIFAVQFYENGDLRWRL